MRATWTAAALTAALSLTTVTMASADVVGANRPVDAARPAVAAPITLPVTQPAGAIPAATDSAQTVATLGSLGDVLKAVDKLSTAATPTAGSPTAAGPDSGILQQLLQQLVAAITDLLGRLGAAPPAPGQQAADPGHIPAAPGSTGAREHNAVPGAQTAANPAEALATLQKDAKELVNTATTATQDRAAVETARSALSRDAVDITAATANAVSGR